MPVNKTSTYVIKGKFENWDDPEARPADTTFSLLTGLSGNTAGVLNQNDLIVDQNGEFEILVSGDPKPADYEGNYLQLTSDSTLIAARDTLADWNNEQPMSLTIERISGPPNSLLAQLGIFAIPLIGPAVSDNATADAAGVHHPAAARRPAAGCERNGHVGHHAHRPADGTRVHPRCHRRCADG